MEIKYWLEELRKERKLLIEKTKYGAYISLTILIPTLIIGYDLISHRDVYLLPMLGPLIQQIIFLILLVIITAGPLFFVIMNYWRYQEIEKIIDNILSGNIRKDEDLFKYYKKG